MTTEAIKMAEVIEYYDAQDESLPLEIMTKAAALLSSQAAEIERLKVEVRTEQRLSFRDQVGKLEAEIERKDALLRQALEALENSSSAVWAEYADASMLYGNYQTRQSMLQTMKKNANDHTAAIAAIKQHLGGNQ